MDAPTAAELEANPVVQTEFASAWVDSLPNDPALRHEEGGFIYANGVTGEVSVRRAPPGGRLGLNLSNPPVVADCFLVATYHTHPNPVALFWDPEPSVVDEEGANATRVPWFIISEVGVFVTGPDRRFGGLSGSPGYPT